MNPEHDPSPAAAKPPHWVVMVSEARGDAEMALIGHPDDPHLVCWPCDAHKFEGGRAEAVGWIRDHQAFLGERGLNAYPLDLNGDPFAPVAAEPEQRHPRERRPADLPAPSARQADILGYIEDRIAGNLPPTFREIGRHFEIKSPNGVQIHLKALQKKGFIERAANSSRSIRLTY